MGSPVSTAPLYVPPADDVPGASTTGGRAAHTYRLTVAYDGTDFFGWQVQPGLPTIQGTLAAVILRVTGTSVLPQGSGRTDTGVHAEGQAVSLCLHADIPAARLCRALNRVLPPAIRVLSAEQVSPTFHARAGVLNKTYEYRIFERRPARDASERICPPHQARYVWDCRWPLEMEPMKQAAEALIGTHDFTSFAATDPDRTQRNELGNVKGTVRTIHRSHWERDGQLLIYRVTGDGFLHHMVRNIVGTCVDVGSGRLRADSIPSILRARDRRLAGRTAPPQGLHLMQVVHASEADNVKLPASESRSA